MRTDSDIENKLEEWQKIFITEITKTPVSELPDKLIALAYKYISSDVPDWQIQWQMEYVADEIKAYLNW
jgi:hypothetical protein